MHEQASGIVLSEHVAGFSCVLLALSLGLPERRHAPALGRLMGDVEEVLWEGIRQAVEFPHSPDEATYLHDGYRSGAADNRCRRGRDGNGAGAITIGEGTGIRNL